MPLPEHPREQDCVTRSLPSLLCSPPFQPQLPVVSSQLPETIPPLGLKSSVGMTN